MPPTLTEDATRLRQPQPDWEDILDILDEQRCVLFLGSGVYPAAGGATMEGALALALDAANPENPYIQVLDSDGFYLFSKRRKVIPRIREFYSQPFPEAEALLTQIARIPFSIIFTLTPDNLLARTYDVLGLDYQSDFYFRNRPAPEQFDAPTRRKPLIYNLMGNIEEPESLVLTHGDFFDYLQSVFIGNSMNRHLKDELEKAQYYIFLGLPYEKWFFKILLRVLSLHSEKLKEVERLAIKEFENPSLHRLYTEDFKLEFFADDDGGTATPAWFISELYRRCEKSGRLKTPPPPDPAEANLPDPTPEQLREWLAQADTTQAMLNMKVYLQRRRPRSQPLADDLVVLRNRFNLLRQRELRGTIDSRDLSVEQSQIVERLLELIDLAQNL